MPLTTLDPKTALIVIDLQKGILARPELANPGEVVRQAVTLLEAFRKKHLPVVLVHVVARPTGRTDQGGPNGEFPPEFFELLPELKRQDSDIVVEKRSPGAFTNTTLHQTLQAQGVTQVVIVGIATSIGVESTARQAYELGYNVTLPVDAMTDMSAEAHRNSLSLSFPRMAETGSTQDVIRLLPG